LENESAPATASEYEPPVRPVVASATVSPPASEQCVHTAAARPDDPECTSALAWVLPTAMPTASPVSPVVAVAELVSSPLPVPSVMARGAPELPDVELAPLGPVCATPIASASPVDPEVA
jgi:hypothetical protein